ncbi:hypothetical protein ACELLULO517_07675 [Acidisoma cellulosilytica]|uniref:Uncharacterized protein n=1 Tax=Acidisoma cellulosilyticum TaxID=2802395 RepID=A0A964E2X9_9PROT|nr:hypothetical protein [Acidisoma cellulosilyticum]MCB8880110.1 hypothetical protein [Acidisoma cellulosilyticum]
MLGRAAFSEPPAPIKVTPSVVVPAPAQPQSLGERLQGIARRGLADNQHDRTRAKTMVLSAIRHDPNMLWEFFAPFQDAAINALFHRVAPEPARLPPRQPECRPAPLRPRPVAAMVAAAGVAAQSLLDTFKIGGRPVGDVTPKVANAWALQNERNARFVRLLTANLPTDQPIRKFRSAEDAQRCLAEANDHD